MPKVDGGFPYFFPRDNNRPDIRHTIFVALFFTTNGGMQNFCISQLTVRFIKSALLVEDVYQRGKESVWSGMTV